jgi:uncharacterized Zn-binding protein involved in type VI secretion
MIRIAPIAALAACILVQGSVALAGQGNPNPPRTAVATSLHITYTTRDFALHYTLRCDPASGTLAHPATACAAIAHHPIMVHGEPPQPPGTGVRSCPPPAETVDVTGTYDGAPAAAHGDSTCGGGSVLHDWQPFLPSRRYLDKVRVNKGAGPLELGEPRAIVRSLLGAPSKTNLGADIYVSETTAIEARTPSGRLLGFVREMFAVGYDRHGDATTIISNWLAATGRSALPLPHPRSVVCAGRRSLASRAPNAPGPTTILWPSSGNSTVVVTSAATAACRLARATEQPVVNGM